MGEMMADTLRDEIEIGKAVAAENIFKTSISFGRFENDLLSWERWSSFSQNKYLEEVEKCSTPGSVAEKKAYFEAHYKKIAARKAELLDEEQKMGPDSLRSDIPIPGNPITNGFGTKLEFDSLESDEISKLVGSETHSTSGVCLSNIDEQKQVVTGDNFRGLFGQGDVDGSLDSPKSLMIELTPIAEGENQLKELQSQVEELSPPVKEENWFREEQVESEETSLLVKEEDDSTGLKTQVEEVATLVQEENPESQKQAEEPKKLENDRVDSQLNKAKDAKLKTLVESQNVKPQSTMARTTKKQATPTPRTAQSPLSRASKPASVSPMRPTSRISNRKDSSPSLPRNKSPSVVQSKRSSPNSLHMSLSLEPANSDSAFPTMTRRSFIMEKMGDKEIVKRAFRTFQNNSSLSTSLYESKPSIPKQVHMKGTERTISSSMTSRKDKEGVKKATAVANSQRGQVGGRWSSVSAGPAKAAREHQTSTKAAPSTFGLRSDEKADRRKELLKKSEKSNSKEVVKTRVQPTQKEKKEAEVKTFRQGPTKATPVPDRKRVQGVSKTYANKDEAK